MVKALALWGKFGKKSFIHYASIFVAAGEATLGKTTIRGEHDWHSEVIPCFLNRNLLDSF